MSHTLSSFFAGVGGIDLGFEQAGQVQVLYANEFDKYAVTTYNADFKIPADYRDIHEVLPEEVPDSDIIAGGFPCQAFSIAGKRQGFDDEKGRGTLFFELMRIVRAKQPRVVFLENVRNLVSHDNGNTFRVILEELENAGYHAHYKVLNAKDYGNMPQNRERIYIVAFHNITDSENFSFPSPIPLTTQLKDIIDFSQKVDEKYYYTPQRCKKEIYDTFEREINDPDAI